MGGRRSKLCGLTLAALLACAALGPAQALGAGTVSVFDNFDGTFTLDFDAGAGDTNNVTVTSTAPGSFTVTDTGAVINSTDCTGSGTNTVVCTEPGLVFMTAQLADMDDRFDLQAPLRGEFGMRGGDGDDTVLGGGLRDFIEGGEGSDELDGRDGPDHLSGGEQGAGDASAPDTVRGGAGSDLLNLVTFDGADDLDGGPGIDDVRAFTAFLQVGYRFTLDGIADDGLGAQGANLRNIENLAVSEGVEFIRGTNDVNEIDAFDGDDDIDPLGGPDVVDAGSQDDTIEARDGFSDRIQCGTGTDTVFADQLDDLAGCENVSRSFVAPFGTPAQPRDVVIVRVPPLTLADCETGKNTISLSAAGDVRNGTALGDLIFGAAGNDVIDGLGGDDCLDLGAGDDRGQGGAGRDLVLGGAGADRASGGAGNDRLDGDAGSDRVSGGSGADRLRGESGRDRISGGGGRDRISGGSGGDRISGGGSRDAVSAGSGDDRIGARDGQRDRINCGSGNDRVRADDGDRVSRNCELVIRS